MSPTPMLLIRGRCSFLLPSMPVRICWSSFSPTLELKAEFEESELLPEGEPGTDSPEKAEEVPIKVIEIESAMEHLQEKRSRLEDRGSYNPLLRPRRTGGAGEGEAGGKGKRERDIHPKAPLP